MKKTLGKITLVYYLMYIAVIAAMALGYYAVKNGFAINVQSQTGIAIQSIVIMYIIISVPFSLYFFHRMTKKWQLIDNEEEKLKHYEKWSTFRLCVTGFGLFAGVIMCYLMHSSSMLCCAGIAAIGLFFCKPSQNKIISELDLTD